MAEIYIYYQIYNPIYTKVFTQVTLVLIITLVKKGNFITAVIVP